MSYRSVFKPGLFEGQTVIVTGGGSGIGRCTAHEIAALGAHVVITGRKPDKLATVKAEIEETLTITPSPLACNSGFNARMTEKGPRTLAMSMASNNSSVRASRSACATGWVYPAELTRISTRP